MSGEVETFVDRVSDRHFPWHYTAFGVSCACGRPVLIGDDCAVVLRARRWETAAPVPHPEPQHAETRGSSES